jgi:DNA topoisomerase I
MINYDDEIMPFKFQSKIINDDEDDDDDDDKEMMVFESPSKIKTVQKILASIKFKKKKKWIILASYGHVRDLARENMGIDIENNFSPNYIISPDKKSVVSDLKKLSKKCKKVWLFTDYDREGESIAWHLSEVMNLKKENTFRGVFQEITKKAILNAIEKPQQIDLNMFYSQQARRILDRLIGFLITPVLWKNFNSTYQKKNSLSAGRVQTVALRIVKERDDEIKKFQKDTYFKITGIFEKVLDADLSDNIISSKDTQLFLEHCKKAEFSIDEIKKKLSIRKPSAPYITSSLQQEASNKLSFSPKKTMMVAQKLYEAGHITYMRTDSKALSDDAIQMISKEILEKYGEKYLNITKYDKKVKGSQEAHEAIRPSNFENKELPDMDTDENKLYKLIWNKTVASQMSPAKVDTLTITISISDREEVFISKAEKVNFDGFLIIFPLNENQETMEILKKFKKGQKINYTEINATQKCTKPPHGYFTEASLIKKLEDNGVGRPSTYSSIISTIQDRNYVVKEDRKGEEVKMEIFSLKDSEICKDEKITIINKEKQKIFITDTGGIICNFLVKNFTELFDYNFTAKVEKNLDEIAEGKKVWYKVIKSVYDQFNPKILELQDNNEKDNYKRDLGENITVYIGKYGPVVCKKGDTNKYSSLGNYKIETITLEEAKELFKYPLKMGKYENKEITLNNGKHGFYLKWNQKNYSCNDSKLNLEDCIEIIENKSLPTNNVIKEINDEIVIKKGRYGPYISYQGKLNVSIPRNRTPKELTKEQCMDLINSKKK